MGEIVAEVAARAIEAVVAYGYPGLALLLFLENLIPPIPSELLLPLAGFLVGQGHLAFPLVLLAATVGATGGLLVLYLGGRWLGEERVRYAVKRFGRMVFLYERDFENVRRWFRRHGDKAVFFSHLVPTFSGPVAVLAGVHRMRPFWFLVYSAAGSAIWAALLVGLGWGLGESWRLVQEYAQPLGYIGLVALAGVVVWLVRRRVVRGATARGEV